MVRFNFNSLNKFRHFDVDTSGFEYTNLETLYKTNGADKVYNLRGVYISNKSLYDEEAPVIATDSEFVNIPVHQLPEIKAMINSEEANKCINNGLVGFTIESYYQKHYDKTFYVARWCNIDEATESSAQEEIPFV